MRRSLTLWHAVLYGLGVTIGAGIYVLIAPAAARAGMAAPLAFAIAALAMALTAGTFAELGARLPFADGAAAFARTGFASERAGDAIGLITILLATFTSATISVGAAGYIRVFVDVPVPAIVVAVVLAMGLIAAYGIVESVTLASIMTVIEIGGLCVIVGLGLAHSGTDAVARMPEMIPPGTLAAWKGMLAAGLLAVFAFIGFEGLVNVAEELDNPRRNLPLGILLTLLLSLVLYMLVVWVALLAVGPQRLAASSAPIALVFTELSGLSPRYMSAVAIVATLNGIIVNIIIASRVMYGLAQHNRLPSALGQVSRVTHTPLIATAVAVAMILILALLVPLEHLADVSSRITLVLFTAMNVALVAIKARRTPAPAHAFTVPSWVPWLGAASTAALLVADLLI